MSLDFYEIGGKLRIEMGDEKVTIFYDRDCGLCDRSVRLVKILDYRGGFSYLPLTSEEGQGYGLELGTMATVVDGEIFLRSEAVRVLLREAGGFSALASIFFGLIPLKLRDAVYRWVAKNRYRWFGGSCSI